MRPSTFLRRASIDRQEKPPDFLGTAAFQLLLEERDSDFEADVFVEIAKF